MCVCVCAGECFEDEAKRTTAPNMKKCAKSRTAINLHFEWCVSWISLSHTTHTRSLYCQYCSARDAQILIVRLGEWVERTVNVMMLLDESMHGMLSRMHHLDARHIVHITHAVHMEFGVAISFVCSLS